MASVISNLHVVQFCGRSFLLVTILSLMAGLGRLCIGENCYKYKLQNFTFNNERGIGSVDFRGDLVVVGCIRIHRSFYPAFEEGYVGSGNPDEDGSTNAVFFFDLYNQEPGTISPYGKILVSEGYNDLASEAFGSALGISSNNRMSYEPSLVHVGDCGYDDNPEDFYYPGDLCVGAVPRYYTEDLSMKNTEFSTIPESQGDFGISIAVDWSSIYLPQQQGYESYSTEQQEYYLTKQAELERVAILGEHAKGTTISEYNFCGAVKIINDPYWLIPHQTEYMTILPPEGEREYGGHFGWSVGIWGRRAIIGAPGSGPTLQCDNFNGRAFILSWTDTSENWTKLESGRVNEPDDGFGWDVALNDQYAVVSFPSDYQGFMGEVHIFDAISGDYITKLRPYASEEEAPVNPELFGYSVAIRGDIVYVGAPNHEHEFYVPSFNDFWPFTTGAVYVFDLSDFDPNDEFLTPDRIIVPNDVPTDVEYEYFWYAKNNPWGFGHDIAANGERVAILANWADGTFQGIDGRTGAVYVLDFAPDADFDEDGDVDGNDFLIWQMNYPTESGATHGDGDADWDGDVDAVDLSIWSDQFGS